MGRIRASIVVVCLTVAACAEGGPNYTSRRDAASSDAGPGDAGRPDGEGGLRVDAGPGGCDDDAECDDGLACNGEESCGGDGRCVGGTAVACDDGVDCTNDVCREPDASCASTPDDAACGEGLVCDVMAGCLRPPACTGDAECDDRMACNGTEYCDPMVGCRSGAPVTCDDGVTCTVDRCTDPAGSCTHVGTDADSDGELARGCLMGNDCDDADPSVRPGAAEVCNGRDDNCNGPADDGPGMMCVLGSGSRGCTTACMTSGTQLCSMSCTYSTCVAATETCGNMCDDDGDGVPDDGCAPPGPPNDLCTGAYALAGLSGTRSDTFNGATRDAAAGCGSGGEIWYSFTTARETIVYFDSIGTGFDTTISIRSGCGSMPLQCEDDDCGLLQDQLVRVVPAGTYQVAVHAYSAGTTTGTVALRWQMIGATAGDDVRITGNGTTAGSTAGASGLMPTIPCMNPLAGASAEDGLYFTRCPGMTGTVTATSCTGTTYDSVLYVRAAGDADLACNDDTCALQSTVSAGYSGPGLYLIVVDGYNTATGSYSVAVSGL